MIEMYELLILLLSWLAGATLGAIFFCGLWWTVGKGLSSARPAVWFFGSLLLRISTTLAGFYLVGAHHWERLALCLLGFVSARFAVTRSMQLATEKSSFGRRGGQPCT